MKFIAILISLVASMAAQTTGTVTSTSAVPASAATVGRLVATAGAVSCTITGNLVPATSISISCKVGAVTIPTYTISLPAGTAYTFQHNFGLVSTGDSITVIAQSDVTGKITATATANGVSGAAPTVF